MKNERSKNRNAARRNKKNRNKTKEKLITVNRQYKSTMFAAERSVLCGERIPEACAGCKYLCIGAGEDSGSQIYRVL